MSIRLRGPGTLLAITVLLTQTTALHASEEGVAPAPALLKHMVVSNGIIFGPLMMFLALSLFILILALAWGLRRAPENVAPSVFAPQERALRWVGGIGLLSPLLGLLGTLLGVILSCMTLAQGGHVDGTTVAIGMSHALVVVFEGIFLACIAIPAYVLFKNRLQRLTLAGR
jgi:hypothetical protein